ncbi:MAG: hypothetical protein QOJ51_201 [Acidobacteriaceae bacterium]|jgi:hypothetical protein|nr:hypothetical protein [Acidobacteriaceae bacterium]
MSHELRFVSREMVTISPTYQPAKPRTRNLGAAILLAAVQDYRGMDEERHKDAERFLYPQTLDSQDHYDWVVSLADELNPAWLRDALDRSRSRWDWQRGGRILATGRRRGIGRRRKSDEARKCS